jgi:hypothetical protein
MRDDAGDLAQAEADTQYPMFDGSDDELERAACREAQAIPTIAYCTQYWICPF